MILINDKVRIVEGELKHRIGKVVDATLTGELVVELIHSKKRVKVNDYQVEHF